MIFADSICSIIKQMVHINLSILSLFNILDCCLIYWKAFFALRACSDFIASAPTTQILIFYIVFQLTFSYLSTLHTIYKV